MARKAGQIIRRGDRKFLIRIYLGLDANGKRKYHNQTIHGTKKEAQQALTDLLLKQDKGQLAGPVVTTLNAYLDHWLETAARPRLRPKVFLEYAAQLVRYVRPALGSMRLSQLSPLAIQGLYGGMLARGLSVRTVRLAHAILRNALRQAVKWRILASNPADAVDLPKQQRKEMLAMTEAEAARFLAATAGGPWHELFALLLSTGLRPSEAIALRWTDLDLPGDRLMVQRKATRVGGRWLYEEPKTSKSRRTIDLPQEITKLLNERVRDGDLVFSNGRGEPPDLRTVTLYHFKPALERAGLPISIRLYDLRHTHATLLLLAGIHPKIVSERLGHSSITITLDTYSHVLPGMQKESADTVGEPCFHAARAANRDVRVFALGTSSSQSNARERFTAAAVATCCSDVFARPR